MAVLIDASFILALDNTADVHHEKARTLWSALEKEQKFISDYIFDEVMSVTLRKIGKERAQLLGEHILKSLPIIMLDKQLFNEAWILFKKEHLSFTDCTLIVLAKLGKLTIATFDKELRKTYQQILPK